MKCVVPRFRNALCCLPLRYGTIVLVYFNLVPSAILGMFIYHVDISKLLYRAFTMTASDQVHRIYRSKISPHAMLVIVLAFWLAEFSMSIVALVGLHKNKLNLLKIFLHYTVGVTMFMVFVRMLDVIPVYWKYDIGGTFVFAAFKIYFILTQRSLVKTMIEKQKEEPMEPQLEMMIPIEDIKVDGDLTDKTEWSASIEEHNLVHEDKNQIVE